MVFSRKISRAKWEKALEVCKDNIDSFPADTLTSDMRTTGNTLSIWCVDNLEDTVLAMMANDNARLERIDILYMNSLKNLETMKTEGNTKVKELIDKHIDLVNLNYKSIGEAAKLFLTAYKEKSYKSYKKTEIKNILLRAIQENKIKLEEFNDNVQKALQ